MKKYIAKLTCFAVVAAALFAAPAISFAADGTNAPAGDTQKKAQHNALPYHGKVTAVDAAAMTFTIGEVYSVESKTKITKEGKPAVFADITVGAYVSGSYKKSADGKNDVSSVRIGEPKKKKVVEGAAPADKATPKQDK